MNRDVIAIAVCCIIAIVGMWYYKDEQRKKILQQVKESVLSVHRPRVIHFYAKWCGPCRDFEPTLKNTLKLYGNAFDCEDIDIGNKNARMRPAAFGTTAIPTCVFFDRYGNKVGQVTGAIDSQELDQYLKKAIAP
jgi:thiol-disulfide isomerase/thioredoxin